MPTDSQSPRILPKQQLSIDALRLSGSIDSRLGDPDWSFTGEHETAQPGRLLLAACMRHTARLLSELDGADKADFTFAARMVARTLYESLILAAYLAYFPDTGYNLVKSNFRAHVGETIVAVKKLNESIASDAEANGEKRIPPPVTTASLEGLMKDLGTSSSKLPIELMVREISAADTQGFFRDNLRRLHLIYRAASLFAPHTNYWVLKGYFYADTQGALAPTPHSFEGNDTLHGDRLFTMHMTACVAILVLQTEDHPMRDAHDIVDSYQSLVGATY